MIGASREDDGSATGGRSNLESIAIVAVEGKKSVSDLKKFLIQNFDLIQYSLFLYYSMLLYLIWCNLI